MRRWLFLLGAALAGIACIAAGVWGVRSWRHAKAEALVRLPRGVVHRADLQVTVQAGGKVESANRTQIDCQLESLAVASGGRVLTAGGSSTILEIVPDGATVREGDVLCRLDASAYVELVRQQEIIVEQAHADERKAQLDVTAARLGLKEYKEGVLGSTYANLRGQLKLAESEFRRQIDRMKWVEDMVRKGYMSPGQIVADRLALMRTTNERERVLGEWDVLEKFGGPINIKRLESSVMSFESVLVFQQLRCKRLEERLGHYRKQVDLCTIRAPHEGMVIYANDPNRNVLITEGAIVRQRMPLFYLPNMGKMEVEALINESIVDKVRQGMVTQVQVEALPTDWIEGEVVSVDPLPIPERNWRSGDVKNYLGRIRLNRVPTGLRPGMSALVEILTSRKPRALVVPVEALTIEDGLDYCYVTSDDGVERRMVQVGQGSRNLMEVTFGLTEGEEVVLAPSQIDPEQVDVSEPAAAAALAPAADSAIAAR